MKRWKLLKDFLKVATIFLIILWSTLSYLASSRFYETFTKKIFQLEEIVVFVEKNPKNTLHNKKVFTNLIFDNTDPYYKDIVTKKEFVRKVRSASAVKVISSATADLSLVAMLCVILFLFWAIPILIILLAAIYLRGTKVSPLYDP